MNHPSGRVNDAHTQSGFHVRFEWGLAGAHAITPGTAIAVIVDVLSFTTALSVAVDAGIDVFPWRWKDDSSARFAAEHGATLAVSRLEAGKGDVTLSPESIRAWKGADPIVLPSPNGSTISHELAAAGATVLGASLRNRTAVARWIVGRYDAVVTPIALIAAGERWPDGTLRPAVEDLWGAGSVITALHDAGWTDLSPEARVAMAAFRSVEGHIADELASCASGRELIAAGFADDVAIAAETDVSDGVPLLHRDRFTRAQANGPWGYGLAMRPVE